MKNFRGLLKKEWVLYRSWLLLGIFGGLMCSWLVPYVLHHFMHILVPESQLSLVFTTLVLFAGGLYSVLQFLASLRLDMKAKESWLHSTCSITTLIGAKMVCSLGGYMLFNALFMTIAFYNLREQLVASIGQMICGILLMVIVITLLQLVFFILLLCFFAFYMQLKHMIGRFSIVLTMIAFFLTLDIWMRITESQLYQTVFQHGVISLSKLEANLPKIQAINHELTGEWHIGSLYIVEEVAFLLLMSLLFVAGCKWLEKVVLR